jgi:hypothetical protein
MSEDKFFERIRAESRTLRYAPDGAAMTRLRARIRDRIARPTVASLLAGWFRPLLATLAMVAALAVFTLSELKQAPQEPAFGDDTVEIVMAGDSYRVGD